MHQSLNIEVSKLTPESKLTMLGSCFSVNIAKRLKEDRVEVLSNPFGITFHPLPLMEQLKRALTGELYKEEELFNKDAYWFSFAHHSDMAARSVVSYLSNSNAKLKDLSDAITTSNVIVLTFGSAWVYEKDGQQVANCHQEPNSEFTKRLVETREMTQSFNELMVQLKRVNPRLEMWLCVSPVRHVKDGLPQNYLSKSLLRTFCYEMEKRYANVKYVPSYEIVMDELREDKYYSNDRVHLNDVAQDLLYQYIEEQTFSDELKCKVVEWRSIRQALRHKSKRPFSPSNLMFKKVLKEKLERFQLDFKEDCSNELRELSLEIEIIQNEF